MADGKYIDEVAVQEIFKLIKDYYARKDGYYVDLSVGGTAGNLQSTVNIISTESFTRRTTCGAESTIDGEAYISYAEGNTTWAGNDPVHAKLTSIGASGYNSYNKTAGFAVVPDSGTTAFVVSGTGITTDSVFVIESAEGVQRGTQKPTSLSNSKGIQYLCLQTPNTTVAGDHIRLQGTAPADLLIAFVWSGYNVNKEYEDYTEQVVSTPLFSTNIPSEFSTGMKSIKVGGKTVVADKYDLINGKKFDMVTQFSCSNLAQSSLTSRGVTTDKNYCLYSFTASGVVALGACEIGNSNTFTLTQTALATSGTYSGEMFCANAANTLWFAISFDHDHSTDYTEDTAVIDATTFASELAAKIKLYTESEGVYSEATEYTEGATYYYRASLGGQYILDQLNAEGNAKTILMQKRALNYTGGSATKGDYTYAESDFGQEWAVAPEGYNVPVLSISYPLDIKSTVQTLQKSYISNESFDELCAKIEDVAGLKITRNGYDEAKGHQTFDVVDTKETIDRIETWSSNKVIFFNDYKNNRKYVVHSLITNGYLCQISSNYIENVKNVHFEIHFDNLVWGKSYGFSTNGFIPQVKHHSFLSNADSGVSRSNVSFNNNYLDTNGVVTDGILPFVKKYGSETIYYRLILHILVNGKQIETWYEYDPTKLEH